MDMLAGKVAIITGATGGIGRATAELFAYNGACLILNARGEKAVDILVDEIVDGGGRAYGLAGDISDPDVCAALVELAQERFGGLDIAFNNAGVVGDLTPLADMATRNWQVVLDTNLGSAFHCARAQIPALLGRGGGSLIFTSSFVGNSVGLPGMSAYAAAKAGLVGLVKGIAADYAALGIRANALLPGGTRTAMAGDAAQQQWAAGLHAMKRIGEPVEIAQAALFLASDMASFVTGTALYADGGNAAVKL